MPLHRFFLPAVLLLAGINIVSAAEDPPSPAVADFERFIIGAVPVCQSQPAELCVDDGWAFTDTNADGGISTAEARTMRTTMGDWFFWRQESLSKQERSALALGLFILDAVGVENILAGFDSDSDGQLTRAELLADVKLDQRPLGEILADPDAVDRDAVARRLGAAAPFLDGLLR